MRCPFIVAPLLLLTRSAAKSTSPANVTEDARLPLEDYELLRDLRSETSQFHYVDDLSVQSSWEGEDFESSFSVFNQTFHVHAEKVIDMFAPNYQEVTVAHDGTHITTWEGARHCMFRGIITTDDGEISGHAHFSTCTGGMDGLLRILGELHEIQWLPKERRHVIANISQLQAQRMSCIDPETKGEHHTHVPILQAQKVHELANGCFGSPDKFIEIVIINDHRRYRELGAQNVEVQTANIFHLMSAMYAGGRAGDGQRYPGIFKQGVLDCKIHPVLKGQITWKDRNMVDYPREGGEVDGFTLLNRMTGWRNTHQQRLRNLFGQVDNVQLLTNERFVGSSVGIAWIGTACVRPDLSSGVNMGHWGSPSLVAHVLAHEMGHNLGLEHVTDAGLTFMYPSLRPDIQRWSDTSRHTLTRRFRSGQLHCLGNNPDANAIPDKKKTKRPTPAPTTIVAPPTNRPSTSSPQTPMPSLTTASPQTSWPTSTRGPSSAPNTCEPSTSPHTTEPSTTPHTREPTITFSPSNAPSCSPTSSTTVNPSSNTPSTSAVVISN